MYKWMGSTTTFGSMKKYVLDPSSVPFLAARGYAPENCERRILQHDGGEGEGLIRKSRSKYHHEHQTYLTFPRFF